jgi:acetyltransferase-like isoleucine patch superfamily enzyme
VPVPANLEIGPGSQIWSRWAFLHYSSRRNCGLRLGRNSALWGMTMLDLGPDGEISIGDFCTILDVTFATNGSVTIGDCAMIGHRVVIAGGIAPRPPGPRDRSGSRVEADPIPAPITIGSNTWITAGSVILPGARIGDDAVVGTGSVVDGEVPPGATAFGNPYRVVKK